MTHVRTAQALSLAAMLMTFTSCHLGNYEKDQPGPGAQAGYYETLATSLTMCTTLPAPLGSTGTVTNCPIEATSHMDSLISYVFSNPVNLQYNSTTGTYDFAPNPEAAPNPIGFNVPVESDGAGNLFFPNEPISNLIPMADSHPNCQVQLSVGESGTYSDSGPFNSGTDLPVLGRVAMTLTWTYAFSNINGSNDCSFLTSCYSGTGCTADDQGGVEGLFYNFVSANILTVAQISSVQQLQYTVSFQ